MSRRAGKFAAILVVAAVTLTGCDYTASKGLLAQMVEVNGDGVTLRAQDQPAGDSLVAGALIGQGATISTAAENSAAVALLPGIFVRLDGSTALDVEHLTLVKAGDDLNYAVASRQVRVRLEHGSISATTPLLVTHVDLRVATLAGTFVAPAFSSFHLAVHEGSVQATIARGQLTFEPSEGATPTIIEAGRSLEISAATDLRPVLRATTEDERSLERLADAMRTEQSAVGWGEKMRGQPPPDGRKNVRIR